MKTGAINARLQLNAGWVKSFHRMILMNVRK